MKNYYDKFPLSGKLTRLRRLRLKQNLPRKWELVSIIRSDFFSKNTLLVARNLLGKYLCRRLKSGRIISAMITETEAYRGFDDRASHAHRGRTQRTEVMFGEPGTIYVYLVYGMHYCLNLVAEKKDYPAAVLVRGVAGVKGPGRVCEYFEIDKKLNGQKLGQELWVEDRGVRMTKSKIQMSKRIGVDYAGESKNWLWRFSLGEMV